MRFDSASASERGGRYASGSVSDAEATLLPREASRVGVVSTSSTAEPFLRSKRLLSDAFEGRLVENCLAMDLLASGGIETLARSTLPPPVSGSEDLAFLLAEDELAPGASKCGVVHDRELSALIVRESCSIGLNSVLTAIGEWDSEFAFSASDNRYSGCPMTLCDKTIRMGAPS